MSDRVSVMVVVLLFLTSVFSQCPPCLRGALFSYHHGGTELTEEVLEDNSFDAVFHQGYVEVHEQSDFHFTEFQIGHQLCFMNRSK